MFIPTRLVGWSHFLLFWYNFFWYKLYEWERFVVGYIIHILSSCVEYHATAVSRHGDTATDAQRVAFLHLNLYVQNTRRLSRADS